MITLIKRILRGCWFFFWGHIFAFVFYDNKYIQGRWFQGKGFGICAIGWQWVTEDAIARFLLGGLNKESPFPIAYGCRVIYPKNIDFSPDDLNNFQSFGIYYQAIGKITIGKGTYIGPNVGLITSNHTAENLDIHDDPKEIVLGEQCWIGMNSVILPGVSLGDHTIVGAGSVVTKSFPTGNCIIAGNPAKIIKYLNG